MVERPHPIERFVLYAALALLIIVAVLSGTLMKHEPSAHAAAPNVIIQVQPAAPPPSPVARLIPA